MRPITRILVTGGAGSVGLEVLKELHQHKKWYEVKVLEQNTAGVLRKLKPYRKDFQLILGDLCDQNILQKATADIDGDEYAQTKIRAENIVRKSRLKWSIFRLPAIMGPQTRMDPLFFNMPLDTSLEIATAGDTGFALVEAVYHQEDIKGRTFNLSGGEKCRTTYRDFLTQVFAAMGLRNMNLPENAFAQKNFHCGNYADSDQLEEILHFQQDSLEDYYKILKNKNTGFSKALLSLFPVLIKLFLLNKSEPLRARRKKNNGQFKRFFYAKLPG
ncbi:MAG: NAD-dependent epimerase/dehydratase family protein [Bacteroidales bacterium]